MSINYFLAFSVSMALSALLVPPVKRLALTIGAIDYPDNDRRIHKFARPRLGGVAIYLAFTIGTLAYLGASRRIGALLLGITILVIVGAIDDIRGLSPGVKLSWQVVAALVVLAGGIGIIELNSPFGGVIRLDWGRFAVSLGGFNFHITPIANLISLIWMVGLVNALNFLDGMDGLATGVSMIGAMTLFALSISPLVNQPDTALLAILIAGAAAGFLIFNFYPAKIFLGDSGAYILGMILALLAIYSGAKLATASLVLGFVILDGLWSVIRRMLAKKSPFKADRGHTHHLILEAGLGYRQTVLLLYLVAFVFGVVALSTGSFAKLLSLVAITLLMAGLVTFLALKNRRKLKNK